MSVTIDSASTPPIRKARFSVSVPCAIAGVATDPTATITSKFSTDGGQTFATAAETPLTGGTFGMALTTLSGAEMDASLVIVEITGANLSTGKTIIYPQQLPSISTGTLSAGSAGGGTLGTILAYNIVGAIIQTTGGTGGGGTGGANNQVRRIITYTVSTGAFTVSPNWTTTPDATTTYSILQTAECGVSTSAYLQATQQAITGTGLSTLTQSQVTGGAYALDTDGTGKVKISSGTGAGQALINSGVIESDVRLLIGTAWLAPTVAGTPDVNIVKVNNVSVSPVTTIKAVWGLAVDGQITTVTGNVNGSVGSVTGAVGSVTGAVGSVTGNLGGNVNGNVVGSTGSVTGAVGSVTGAVGSVTGSVGSVAGNVSGSVASVVGAVGSVTGAAGSVTGSVGSVAGDVAGKVIGGGAGTISGAGVRADSVTGAVGSVTGAVGSVTGNVGGTTAGVTASGAATFFTVNSGKTYADAVSGSVVKEIASNAGVISGTGSYTIVQPVHNVVGGTNMQGIIVTMFDGATYFTATSDSSGNATFHLNAASYTQSVSSQAAFNFTNNGTVVVSANATLAAVIGTAFSVTPPTNPADCAVYFIAHSAGALYTNKAFTFTLNSAPPGTGNGYIGEVRTATSDVATALVTVALTQQCQWIIKDTTSGKTLDIYIPAATTYAAPDFAI